ncbi:MAG: ammonium transporter [Parasutterella excrementihominis]
MRVTALLLALLSPAAWAAEESAMNAADVSWMMVATTLVLFMTIPGIALFYAGMVRKKNVLSVVMQSFAICCSITIVWYVCGYSLAFTEGNFFIGGFDKVFLHGIGINTMQGSIPEMLFMMFQMTFAILTPALMCGAFAERMKFSALFLFMVLWSLFCYVPICHWVWGPDGWLAAAGALDYAGGTVVHINAGVAGLVACLMLGKRIGYGKEAMAPHNLILAMVGACFLWIGWFGFNGGSGLAADGRAVMAIVVSQIAAAAAALIWMACEYVENKRFTVLGAISGAVAGLVAITPHQALLNRHALFIGLCGGFICYFGPTRLKHWLGYDDLWMPSACGVGGIVVPSRPVCLLPSDYGLCDEAVLEQVWVQTKALSPPHLRIDCYYVLLKLVDVMIGIRVSAEEERMGLDLSLHGERVE